MTRNQNQWIKLYEGLDALWIHDGNPRRPHALLASLKHSNGFFNSRLVIPDDGLMRDAASDLLELLAAEPDGQCYIESTRGVVGPQTGATKLAELLHRKLVGLSSKPKPSFWASPSKGEVDGKKVMILDNKDLALFPKQNILLCEDVLTTGGSVDLTANAVIGAGGIIQPFVLALVNRSGFTELNGRKIIALINHPMPTWTADECPSVSRALKLSLQKSL